jgi:hypothetical protein
MKLTFTIEINISESFTVDDIWPDGDAPENPTADDVRALFLKKAHNVHQTCTDWGLEIRKEDVHITADDPELFERLKDAQARVKKADAGGSL